MREDIREAQDFSDPWEIRAQTYTQILVEPTGLDRQCFERGLLGLLDFRVVRFYICLMDVYRVAVTTGLQTQPRTPEDNDFYDFKHVISSAAADVFVTFDGALVKLLKRAERSEIRVITSIKDLLVAIECESGTV